MVVAINTDAPHLCPIYNPYSSCLFSIAEACFCTVVNGEGSHGKTGKWQEACARKIIGDIRIVSEKNRKMKINIHHYNTQLPSQFWNSQCGYFCKGWSRHSVLKADDTCLSLINGAARRSLMPKANSNARACECSLPPSHDTFRGNGWWHAFNDMAQRSYFSCWAEW